MQVPVVAAGGGERGRRTESQRAQCLHRRGRNVSGQRDQAGAAHRSGARTGIGTALVGGIRLDGILDGMNVDDTGMDGVGVDRTGMGEVDVNGAGVNGIGRSRMPMRPVTGGQGHRVTRRVAHMRRYPVLRRISRDR